VTSTFICKSWSGWTKTDATLCIWVLNITLDFRLIAAVTLDYQPLLDDKNQNQSSVIMVLKKLLQLHENPIFVYLAFSYMLYFTEWHSWILIRRNEIEFHENLVWVAVRSGVPPPFSATDTLPKTVHTLFEVIIRTIPPWFLPEDISEACENRFAGFLSPFKDLRTRHTHY